MKQVNRFWKELAAVSMFLLIGISSLNAQPARQFNRNNCKANLSDEQKVQMREVRIEHANATKDLRNELNELKAHQKTLITADKPNKSEVYANIDKMTAVKKQLMQDRLNMRLEVQSFLTDDQKVMMANRPFGKQGMQHGKRGKMGKGRGMHQGNCDGSGQFLKRGNQQRGDGSGQFSERGKQQRGDGSGAGWRQNNKPQNCANKNALNLSDAQQEQMKNLRVSHLQATKSLRDEAEVIRLKQKQNRISENPDKGQLMANVNRLSEIQNKLAKQKFDHQLEVRKILDKDQLTIFLSRPAMHKGFGRAHCRF
ncbi:Spy/CpxP family protein refolding chaperone [Ancylomarina longa]|uniref:Periplasmic heavy metal sensor n=1 Tax=Ancylomarina longa TaxID=2487017 RepID=A0A434AWE4_9BACT|nr:periplasmic heavy metal sensor [Ancylomarina longa]RUT78720.1 periplasmic heavy metal sensor [Ancylomarina longa]